MELPLTNGALMDAMQSHPPGDFVELLEFVLKRRGQPVLDQVSVIVNRLRDEAAVPGNRTEELLPPQSIGLDNPAVLIKTLEAANTNAERAAIALAWHYVTWKDGITDDKGGLVEKDQASADVLQRELDAYGEKLMHVTNSFATAQKEQWVKAEKPPGKQNLYRLLPAGAMRVRDIVQRAKLASEQHAFSRDENQHEGENHLLQSQPLQSHMTHVAQTNTTTQTTYGQ